VSAFVADRSTDIGQPISPSDLNSASYGFNDLNYLNFLALSGFRNVNRGRFKGGMEARQRDSGVPVWDDRQVNGHRA
jgi:hypothetical protein